MSWARSLSLLRNFETAGTAGNLKSGAFPKMNNQVADEATPGEVKALSELLQYQNGAIVSRVLLKNKGGTVTAFAFDAGEGLSEHTAPFDALVIVTDGDAEIQIAGDTYHVGQGETILLPANRPHAVKAVAKFKMLLIMIRA